MDTKKYNCDCLRIIVEWGDGYLVNTTECDPKKQEYLLRVWNESAMVYCADIKDPITKRCWEREISKK